MAGARLIKLDFWTDGKLLKLPLEARMVYLATWNLADDQGILPGCVEDFHTRMFPADPDLDVTGHIERLKAAKRLVEFIDTQGDVYWWIPRFHWHQKIEEISPRYPLPSDALIRTVLGEKRATEFHSILERKNRQSRRKAWAEKRRASETDQVQRVAGEEPASPENCRTRTGELRTENLEPENMSLSPQPLSGSEERATRPAISQVPKAIRQRAEQLVGRPLGSNGSRMLVQLALVEKHPLEWFEPAFDEAEMHGAVSLKYVVQILRDWAHKGGPSRNGKRNGRVRGPDPPASSDVEPAVTEYITLSPGVEELHQNAVTRTRRSPTPAGS